MNLLRLTACLGFVFLLLPAISWAIHDGEDGPKGIGGAAPPGIGGTGPYDALNMELLGHLSLDQIGGGQANVMGSDCWGWTDPLTGKEYAIAGLTNATSFVDISDPFNPQYLGRLMTTTGNSAWRDMKVYNDHVFIVSDGNGEHGMQVFDLTQLRTADPNNPQMFSNTALYTGVNSSHNIAINEETGYAYIVGSNRASGGLHIVDISDPANPVEVANFSDDGYTHDAQIVNYNGPDADYTGREIAFASNEDTLTIVDVTDKSNLVQISRNGYPDDAYTHQSWLSDDQRFVYLCDELDEDGVGGTRTHIWDLLDLDNPVYKGFHAGTTRAIDHNLYVKDGLIYLASYSAGLRILEPDAADPSQLTEIAYFDTFPTDTDTDFDGAWSCYPYYDSGVVFVNDRQGGVFIVRLSAISFEFPGGFPEMVSPSGGDSFEVNVSGFLGTPQPGTGMLHVNRGNGWEQFPMSESSPNQYNAIFPVTACGEQVPFYVSAQDMDGNVITNPANAPAMFYDTVSADGAIVVYEDNLETDLGWTVTGDAADGQWDRGVPAGDANRGDPGSDGDGSGSCFLTDNAAGNSDVDDGSTILTSPVFDAVGDGNGVCTMLSYYRWYSNDVGNAPASDTFFIEISNDAGESWIELETVGPSGNEVSGGWIQKKFDIADFLAPTDQMRLRFTASDLGDGSVVEAAVDGIKVDILQCNPTITPSPENYELVNGQLVGGTIGSLQESDNDQLRVRRNPSQLVGGVTLDVTAKAHTETPSAFAITIESSAFTRRNVNQIIELFNYETNDFEQVDVRFMSRMGDAVVTIDATGNLARFVAPTTMEIKARFRYLGINNRQSYQIRLDDIYWTITN